MTPFALKPVEKLVFRSASALLAEYHCAPSDPLFRNSGPCNASCIVFPLTSTRLLRNRIAMIETPATVSLFNEGDEYSSEVLSEDGSHCAWLTLDPGLFSELAGSPSKPFEAIQMRADAGLILRQRSLFRFAREFGAAEPLAIEEEAIAIVESVLAMGGDRMPMACSRLIDAARERLAKQFAETLSLAGLARDLSVSPAYLSRSFRRATGQTLHAFREELRLRRSLDLLPDCNGDFTRLALDLGYSSHSHFTTRFRRLFGITPTRFVRSVRGEAYSVGTRTQ